MTLILPYPPKGTPNPAAPVGVTRPIPKERWEKGGPIDLSRLACCLLCRQTIFVDSPKQPCGQYSYHHCEKAHKKGWDHGDERRDYRGSTRALDGAGG